MPKDAFTKNLFVNDVHSKLNRTRVSDIFFPRSVAEIGEIVGFARQNKQGIAVAGKKHAMGGQQFLKNEILIDMSKMNRIIAFKPEKALIEAEAGIAWNKLIEYTVRAQDGAAHQVGIRQKQTGADDLSLGGALAANIHGRGLRMKPFIDDVESFQIVTADGKTVVCSRTENRELFCAAIGGYGLFGIVVSLKLRLMKRRKIVRRVAIESTENLARLFRSRIDDGYLYGDFQFAIDENSVDFLRRGVFSCYRPVSDDTKISQKNVELSPENWKSLLYLAHTDKRKAFESYAAHYLQTDGQIYWTDTHQTGVYLENYHEAIDLRLNKKNQTTSEMITEIYVPLKHLEEFMKATRKDFRRNSVELIYGTIRLIRRDDESFLAWAREDFACIVFNLHVEHTPASIEKAQNDFRRLIDAAIRFGGSFYLTYHGWARAAQISACYPQFADFLELKRKHDPDEVFRSNWYEKYKNLFAGGM